MRPSSRTRAWAAIAAVASLALPAAGCGGHDHFANVPRPATEIDIGAAVAQSRVSVSPARLGAGPIDLIASNQTTTSQEITLRSEAGPAAAKRLQQSTGPINPGDTASLKADLLPGSYSVSVSSPRIAPARITVGPPRPSSQDRPLQP